MKALADKKVLLISAVFVAAAVFIFCFLSFSKVPTAEVTTYSMGSYVQQTVYGANAETAVSEAANNIAKLEDLISWRKPDSDIADLNSQAGGAWTVVDPAVFALLTLSLDVAEKSGGAFDPTIAPVSWLWNFDEAPTAPPAPDKITQFLQSVDYTKLKLDSENTSALLQNLGFAVDLGAVGKGAACDVAVKTYNEAGVTGGIVAVGGSVGCYGSKPESGNWAVAVRDPKGNGSLGALSIKEGFLSTSGSYEKTFTYQGTAYHHLLDPKTGYPAESGLVSVTVLCGSGALSDALATACFVLGLEEGQALLAQYEGAEGLFIDANGGITLTEGLKEQFTLTSQDYAVYE